ncbi:MAG: energy transducer TonB [Deltaproteobacteria bacterium]|nr:energy transducer TonB [Deltaproteobacteria bacterium]
MEPAESCVARPGEDRDPAGQEPRLPWPAAGPGLPGSGPEGREGLQDLTPLAADRLQDHELRAEARAFRAACALGAAVHLAALAFLVWGLGPEEAEDWRPIAVMDLSRFDPLGGQGGIEDLLRSDEEMVPVPEEPQLAEAPEPEPEDLTVPESTAESAEPLPPPPAAPAETPKPTPKPKPLRQAAAPSQPAGLPAHSSAPGIGGSGPGGTPGGSGRGNTDELAAYKAAIRRRLESRKKYPPAAQARRVTGVVRVSFTVHKDGRLSSPALVASSGHGILDDEAMALLARVSPLPPIPDGTGLNTLNLTVPLRFSLN